MRSNGFPLALATLLLPACVLAQELPTADAGPAAVPVAATTGEPAPVVATQDAPDARPVPQDASAVAAQEPSPPTTGAPEVGAPATPATPPANDVSVQDAVSVPQAQELPAAPLDEAPPTESSTGPGTTVDPTTATEPGTPVDPAATEPGTAADPAIPAGEPAAPVDPAATATDPAALAPTQAEEEFAEIYGEEYDPVADSTLPEPVNLPGAYDPWEKYNRQMHRFNNAVDRGVARPLARGYVKVVPRPLRLGVSNFFSNLGQPLAAVNSLLQGKPKQAGQALGRFVLNSTLGIGGIFDPAADAKLPHRNEDFGQTLGVWGWKRSRYVELPLFGPRTVRDVFGMFGDAPLSPLRNVEADKLRVPLQGLQLVNLRAQLLSTDSLREGAEDDYTLVRDAWSMRRDYQIFGDRSEGDDSLPEYLREIDDEPTVPVDAMPVPPTGGGT